MRTRSMMLALAVGAVSAANAQVSTINGMHVTPYVWGDYPSSEFSSSNNYPSSVSMQDHPFSNGNGYANRHFAMFSNDGGATDFMSPGGNDTFDMTMTINVNSTGTPFAFPRRIEAGPMTRWPVQGGWVSEAQMILTNDGEVAAFGDPIPFHSFTNNGYSYTQGTSVQLGYRYFRDTDGKFKWIYSINNIASPALTLANGLPWNFQTMGAQPPYDDNGTPRAFNFGIYMQVMPNQGAPMQLDAFVTMTNISVHDYGFKGVATLQDTTNVGGQPITYEIIASGTTIFSGTLTLDNNSRYSVKSPLSAGVYDVKIKGPTHLAKLVHNVAFNQYGAVVNVSLENGDVDGDNEVGLGDFGILSGAFGTFVGDPGYSAGADLDKDGEVGLADFGIMSGNFGDLGD